MKSQRAMERSNHKLACFALLRRSCRWKTKNNATKERTKLWVLVDHSRRAIVYSRGLRGERMGDLKNECIDSFFFYGLIVVII